ncbi:MAG: ABC transporter permease [Rectinemataceae bacterium]
MLRVFEQPAGEARMSRLRAILSLGLRNLLRNRRRTISTLLAISTGLLGLTLLDGFVTYSMNGFRNAIVESGTGHLQIVRSPSYFDEGDSDPFPFMMGNAREIESMLRAMPQVRDVMPSLSFNAVIVAGGKTATVEVSALPIAQAHTDLSARTIVSGRDMEAGDSGRILVGTGVARKLGLHPGDTVSLFALSDGGGVNTESFTVSGISSSAIAAVDNVSVSMGLGDAQMLVGVHDVPDLIVFLKRTADTAAMAAKLAASPRSSPLFGLTVRSWEQLSPDYRQANSFYRMILGTARLIVLLVALLSISGSLSLSALERYRELGTLRAFGTKRQQLFLMLIAESFFLGIAGALAGCSVGAGVSWIIDAFGGVSMPAEPGMSTASVMIRFTPDISNFFGNGGWVLLASIVGAAVPWLHTRRLGIAELLRSKN